MTSSRLPIPIHDLPLETIGHILTIAHPVDSDEETERQARRHFYLDTSLVCRDWTPFAQRALWKFVHLDDDDVVEELVDSGGAGRYPVVNLSIKYVEFISLGTLLASVRGVRSLKLYECSIEESWLCGANCNWRDLKSLELDDVRLDSSGLSTYTFALTHLSINYSRALPSGQMLVALGRQVSITSLELSSHSSMFGAFDKLLPLASRLVRLDVTLRNLSEVAAAVAVDPFFERCTQLKHFASGTRTIPPTIHIPNPLESWTVNEYDSDDVLAILDVLNSKAVATSKLQRLTIQTYHPSNKLAAILELQSWDGWRELEEVCRQRKIKLSVGWYSSEEVEVIVPGT